MVVNCILGNISRNVMKSINDDNIIGIINTIMNSHSMLENIMSDAMPIPNDDLTMTISRNINSILNAKTIESNADELKILTECLNGVYHYIDDIISYDLFTQDELFRGERLRIDCSTLSPDFMNQTGYGGSYARGHYTLSDVEGGKYGVWDNNSDITITTNEGNKKELGYIRYLYLSI